MSDIDNMGHWVREVARHGILTEKDSMDLRLLKRDILRELKKLEDGASNPNFTFSTIDLNNINSSKIMERKEWELQALLAKIQREKENLRDFENRTESKSYLRGYLKEIEELEEEYKAKIYPDTLKSLEDLVEVFKDKKAKREDLYYAVMRVFWAYKEDLENHALGQDRLFASLENISYFLSDKEDIIKQETQTRKRRTNNGRKRNTAT